MHPIYNATPGAPQPRHYIDANSPMVRNQQRLNDHGLYLLYNRCPMAPTKNNLTPQEFSPMSLYMIEGVLPDLVPRVLNPNSPEFQLGECWYNFGDYLLEPEDKRAFTGFFRRLGYTVTVRIDKMQQRIEPRLGTHYCIKW